MSEPHPVDAAREVRHLGGGRFRVRVAGRDTTAFTAVEGRRVWVWIEGHTWVVESSTGLTTGAAPIPDELSMAVPMPATVVAVLAAPGQNVTRGDLLVRLEAMKMEFDVTAPRDGRVAAVRCTRGELAQPGVPLVELEPQT